MFFLFAVRCSRCGSTFKAEAEERTEPPASADRTYTCPRCYTTGTVSAGDGIPCDVSTPWAVRAAEAEAAK
jgi:hypothetical protein